jgi:hypothetical protein
MQEVTPERVGEEALELIEASRRRAGATSERSPLASLL